MDRWSPLPNFITGISKSSCFTAVQELTWSLQLQQPEKAYTVYLCLFVCVCVCVYLRKFWDDDDDDHGNVMLRFSRWGRQMIAAGLDREREKQTMVLM